MFQVSDLITENTAFEISHNKYTKIIKNFYACSEKTESTKVLEETGLIQNRVFSGMDDEISNRVIILRDMDENKILKLISLLKMIYRMKNYIPLHD